MNLILQLSADTEAKLKEQATLTGRTVEELALEALQEKLGQDSEPASVISPALRLAEFQAWFASHPASATSTVDDSRESIYSDRGL